jgi:hypothetical protein
MAHTGGFYKQTKKNINMKQLLPLFLFLLPCLALAQYPSNGNQKITLGEQTTADGLIWRGVAADTTLTAKSDTAAYFVLDTANLNLYTYKVSASGKKWIQLGSDTTSLNLVSRFAAKLNINDTASMLTNYWRSGRFNGTLPILNGGTGQTTLAAAGIVTTAGGTNNRFTAFTGSTTVGNTNLYRQVSGGDDFIGINVSDPVNYSYLVIGGAAGGQYALVKGTKMFGYFSNEASAGNGSSDTSLAVGNYVRGADISFFTRPPISGAVTTKLKILNNGNVGIGTATPAVQFHTTGGVRFATFAGGGTSTLSVDNNGDLGRTSSIELKNNITNIKYGLNDILKINPINFNWKDENKFGNENENGFVAEDVYTVIPNVVSSDANGIFMDYNKLIPILTKAIQEQQALIKALEQRIINLENK